MIALAFLIIGFLFYVASVYSQDFSKLSFVAYIMTLAFFVLIVFAVYHISAEAKMIYYACKSGDSFDVGRFTRLSDQQWEDSKIFSADSPNTGYTWHFVKPEYEANGKTLTLQAHPSELPGKHRNRFRYRHDLVDRQWAASPRCEKNEFDWGPLYAHCKDSSEHVVSGRCPITDGSGTLQNFGVNDDRDARTCVCEQTVKATARELCAK